MTAPNPRKRTAAQAKPYGREAAMEEILAAARTLFSERGFDAVGVRDVSALANVNHALLHRHFGTKENLLREVIQLESRAFHDAAGEAGDPALVLRRLFAANSADPTFVRILAFCLLSRADTENLLARDGMLKEVIEAMTAGAAGARGSAAQTARAREDARERVAAATALALGWLLYEPFLTAATGIEGAAVPKARARVESLVGQLVDGAG